MYYKYIIFSGTETTRQNPIKLVLHVLTELLLEQLTY